MKRTKIAIMIVLGLSLAGCYPQARVIWGPDGRRAAVLGDDGLYLCDPAGKLSELIIEDAGRVCWYPESNRLCVVSEEHIDNWPDVKKLLTDEQRKIVQAESGPLLREILAYKGDWDKFKPAGKYKTGLSRLLIYLRRKHPEELKARLSEDEWTKVQSLTLEVHRVRTLQFGENAKPKLRLRFETFEKIHEVRVSPMGQTIALLGGARELAVLSPEGKLRPVAKKTSAFPDWSHDGQYLVYCKSDTSEGKGVQLGSITRRRVCDGNGKLLKKFAKPESLAGVLFHEAARVRCLDDGRILFTSPEVHLPATPKDMPQRMNIFSLDPARRPTVVRMIPREAWKENLEGLDFFRLSPNQKRIAILGEDGRVMILTLATGQVQAVQSEKVSAPAGMTVPTWRNNEELCFVVPAGSKLGSTKRPEIVLWSPKPNRSRCLSQDWPEAVVKDWLTESKPTTRPAIQKSGDKARKK